MWLTLLWGGTAILLFGMSASAIHHLRWVQRLPPLQALPTASDELQPDPWPPFCSVVIAARDEAARIEGTVRHLLAVIMSWIEVDDVPSDNSSWSAISMDRREPFRWKGTGMAGQRSKSQSRKPSELLRDLYDRGKEIRQRVKPFRGKRGYGERVYEDVIKVEFDIDPNLARRLAQFVDPVKGYTKSEFKSLCRTCDKHRFVLGLTLLATLLSVGNKKQRQKIENRMIEEKWSRVRLQQELLVLRGRRGKGGRKAMIPSEKKGILWELERLCDHWLRWQRLWIESNQNNGAASAKTRKVAAKRAKAKSGKDRVAEISAKVQKHFDTATEKVESLRTVLAKELQRELPNQG